MAKPLRNANSTQILNPARTVDPSIDGVASRYCALCQGTASAVPQGR
ncbi:MAG: hypothetical protein ACYCO5_09055 [Acidobacteriaceae bacterium]